MIEAEIGLNRDGWLRSSIPTEYSAVDQAAPGETIDLAWRRHPRLLDLTVKIHGKHFAPPFPEPTAFYRGAPVKAVHYICEHQSLCVRCYGRKSPLGTRMAPSVRRRSPETDVIVRHQEIDRYSGGKQGKRRIQLPLAKLAPAPNQAIINEATTVFAYRYLKRPVRQARGVSVGQREGVCFDGKYLDR
jgi:hypothetical protein